MLYMCAKLRQYGTIRENVKQLSVSAYVELAVTQTTTVTSLLRQETSKCCSILIHRCQNKKARSLSLSLLPCIPCVSLSLSLSADNGYTCVSQCSGGSVLP